jgi:hypothetical protein
VWTTHVDGCQRLWCALTSNLDFGQRCIDRLDVFLGKLDVGRLDVALRTLGIGSAGNGNDLLSAIDDFEQRLHTLSESCKR